MLTREEIDAESSTIDATTQAMVITEIRSSVQYLANPSLFSDLSTQLTNASGTVKGKMVNAAVLKLAELGPGVASLTGGEDAVNYSQKDAKYVWRKYILNLFYTISDGVHGVDVSTVSIEDLIEQGLVTDYKAGQRNPSGELV